MPKSDYLKRELAAAVGTGRVDLPSGIAFDYCSETKTVHMRLSQGVKANMQTDPAAFEGWALALYGNLPHLVEVVTLDWDEPKTLTSRTAPHYNRFLYRVQAFDRHFDWFSVQSPAPSWEQRVKQEKWPALILNREGTRDDGTTTTDNPTSEPALEPKFINEWEGNLKEAVELNFGLWIGKIERQLPVGVFAGEVKTKNTIFTGRKSAIDLWGISTDKALNIFELKAAGNVKIGIISELFFYATVIYDALQGKIESQTDEFAELESVNAFFLTQRLHPLITDRVIELLDSADKNISYKKLMYDLEGNLWVSDTD